MATWDELHEALDDYTVSCNTNDRLRKMQKDWTRVLHFVCADTSDTFTMDVQSGEINPMPRYLRGEIQVRGSQEDIMRLDAISYVIWPDV